MHIPESKLKNIFIKSNLITDDVYEKAKEESGRVGVSIEDFLVERGGVNEKYLAEAIADYLKVPIYYPKVEEIPYENYSLIPETVAKTKDVFVVGRDDHSVTLAMTDPNDWEIINYVETKFGCHVEPNMVSRADLSELMKLYRRNIKKEFQKIIEENTKKLSGRTSGKEKELAAELPVITIFDTILEHAAASKASDIHIEGRKESVVIRYRIDGILHDIVELPLEAQQALVARIKILAQLQIDEHRTPQDGRFKFVFEDEDIAVRVSVMPTLHGEKAVLRLLASSRRPLSLKDLGATEKNLELLGSCILKANGLIIVTGPTGCGKTTTLYTMLTMLNKPEVSIATIEDPIEYDIAGINQTQVNEKTGLTFAEGLRSFLRQNPDIMMIGEIRDKETAELGIHASLTGHLVLSTLHTDDAATTIPRLLDLGVEQFLLASTLRTAIAQRLVRRICRDCAESYPLPEELKKLILEQIIHSNKYKAPSYKLPAQLYKGKGCNKCGGTGYKGQIGIFEILDVTPQIADLILQRTSAEIIKDFALQQGMITMFEDGMEKVEEGVTTLDEVFRVTRM